jgi:DNA polymerase-3 subunit gamma/tau
VCDREKISAEAGAILRLARAAAGSMRDGLSLLDQALAFGDGQLRDADVAEMLGSLDRARLTALLEALAAVDAPGLLAQVRQLDELAPDYADVLAGLATMLQQIAVVQIAGPASLEPEAGADGDGPLIVRLADTMAPETVQLMYQIAVMGRRDLPLAPDPRTGFEMALLRMVAFHPERHVSPGAIPASPASAAHPAPRATPATVRPAARPVTPVPAQGEATAIGDWSEFVAALNIDGAARQLAAHCALVAQSPGEIRLTLDKRNGHLLTDNLRGRLVAALQERLGSDVKVLFTSVQAVAETPADRQTRSDDEELRRAREKIAADSNVREMAELFGAEVIPDSIRQNPKSTPGK